MKRLGVVVAVAAMLALTGTAVATVTLSGRYKTVIQHGQQAGTWVIKFTPGQYHVKFDGQSVVHGNYTISGNVITLQDQGAGACSTPGKYKVKLNGNTLKFKLISDSNAGSCQGREGVLSHKFTKIS